MESGMVSFSYSESEDSLLIFRSILIDEELRENLDEILAVITWDIDNFDLDASWIQDGESFEILFVEKNEK